MQATTLDKILAGIVVLLAALGGAAFFGVQLHLGGSDQGVTAGTITIPAGGVINNPPWYTNGLYSGANQNLILDGNGNIIQTSGTVAVNELIQGTAGYQQSFSTANGTTFSVTPAQWCAGTHVLAPLSNTTTITVTFPAASTTYALCGAVAGAWSTQIFENESSFAVTLATTTGGNGITFYQATNTPYILFPPKVLATTTEVQMGTYTTSSALNMYRTDFYRPAGF